MPQTKLSNHIRQTELLPQEKEIIIGCLIGETLQIESRTLFPSLGISEMEI
jgi:hypothetical protein